MLVVLSSENKITVWADKKTKKEVVHPSGFFLSELMVPVQALMNAGYTPVFANPNGNEAIMDATSDKAVYFGGNEKHYRALRTLCVKLGICGDKTLGTKKLSTLSQFRQEGLEHFVGLLVPGGHAPMEDLWKDPDLGHILRYFHSHKKPTALICHGPIALLAALQTPEKFIEALQKGDVAQAAETSKDWPYRNYVMTSFSTKEEQQAEPGQGNALGGFVRFYPDEALDSAGAKVLVRANPWKDNSVEHEELLTAQNPFSDHSFASKLVKMLDKAATKK
ncbi:MAG: DJ-1/PfpI family protein [Deltaproteobacteria bacterium]|nr:DJ-1/PfpI family protein [Deltaproteobacteria bacterium]